MTKGIEILYDGEVIKILHDGKVITTATKMIVQGNISMVDVKKTTLIEALTHATKDLETCAMLMDEKGMSTEWINRRIKINDAVLKKWGVKI
jgi:signal-transduction protein with cAMP-binding, CBS, and nucleotidyltransferase domain